MQNSTTPDLSYWTLIGKLIAALLAVTAISSIATDTFNPALWIIVTTPLAAGTYAYKRTP